MISRLSVEPRRHRLDRGAGRAAATAWIGVYGALVPGGAGQRGRRARRRSPALGAGGRRPCSPLLLVLAFAARWAGPRARAGAGDRGAHPAAEHADPRRRRSRAIAAAHQKMMAHDARGLRPRGRAGGVARERGLAVRPASVTPRSAPTSRRWPRGLRRPAQLAALRRRAASTTPRSWSSAAARPRHYDKRHLVPFGEYVPLQRRAAVRRQRWRATPATSPPAIASRCCRSGRRALGLAICFEVTFPVEVAALAREGATALVTLTNDAWYGDTAAPWQHLRGGALPRRREPPAPCCARRSPASAPGSSPTAASLRRSAWASRGSCAATSRRDASSRLRARAVGGADRLPRRLRGRSCRLLYSARVRSRCV